MLKKILQQLINHCGLRDQVGIKGRVRLITTDAKTGKVLASTPWHNNLVVNSADHGKNLIAQRLAGLVAYSTVLQYGEIGTGNTAPTAADIALTTPVVRVALAGGSVTGNIATVQYFFSDGILPMGTYREFGTFIDGSPVLGSGQMFNHVLFATPYNKVAGQDTTVEVQFTIN